MQRGIQGPSHAKVMAKNRVNLSGYKEQIWQPFYDYKDYAFGGAASTIFFQEPQGQNGKGLADTNMELSGQIPKGQAFLITGVQVEILPGINPSTNGDGSGSGPHFVNDIYQAYKGGTLVLRIGSKEYIRQGNLMKFPPVNRLAVDSSVAIADAADKDVHTSYATAAGREFAVNGLLLESNQNFDITIRELAALPSGVDARIGVTLNGWLYRNSQ